MRDLHGAKQRSATDTSSTERSEASEGSSRVVQALAVVLEASRPDAGSFTVSLDGVNRVDIGRGPDRRATRRGAELRLDLPDRRISKLHARIERAPEGFVLSDEGSSNGTFLGGPGPEERVTKAIVAFEQPLRVGHTVLALLADGAPILDRARLGPAWPFATLSATFARELSRLERVASSPIPLLLLGETGTGKEVLARAVHERSGRPGPFVAINCGAIPPNLVEAQLFGHLKGAFSGAVRDEPGFVRGADDGTLFLDEIGDLPLVAQASLLRVLQEGEVTPVGSFRPVKVDVRVISATHQPLPARVASGAFRADLFARLAGFSFRVPPLRERRLDVGGLIASFCRGSAVRELRLDAALGLVGHDYPMNVRELQQAIAAAAILAEDGVVRLADLPSSLAKSVEPTRESALDGADVALRAELAERLRASGNNVTRVAREMGKARQQVQRWVKRFGLKAR
jgi:transcriptional regulator of acetoin/glycerol metabolism